MKNEEQNLNEAPTGNSVKAGVSRSMPKWCKVILWITHPVLMIMLSPSMIERRKRQKEAANKKERAIMKNFKVEVQSGFLCNKVRYIQREKPLTDEELNAIYSA